MRALLVHWAVGLTIFFVAGIHRTYRPGLEPAALVQLFGILVVLVGIVRFAKTLNRRG